jgi:hypothetical protein
MNSSTMRGLKALELNRRDAREAAGDGCDEQPIAL